MKQPLVGLCIFFSLGILLGAHLKVPFIILYLLTFLFLIFSFIFIRQNAKFAILILCLAFFFGATSLKNSQVLPHSHIANFTPYKSKSVYLTGVIDDDPIYKSKSVSFVLKAKKLKIGESWQKTCGKVLVRVFGRNTFSYGDRLLLEGKLYRPFSFRTSERFDYRRYLKHRGIYSILSVKKNATVKQLGKGRNNPLKSFAFCIRHKIRKVVTKKISPMAAIILNAIILGERQNLPAHVRNTLVRSGTVHILATEYTKKPNFLPACNLTLQQAIS